MGISVLRHPANPIIVPGVYDWRWAVVFNPGVIKENGRVYLYERAAGQLRPLICYIGMLESDDGIHFTHSREEPVFTPDMAGSPYGSVQDPRITRLDGRYYMTYAYRPYAWSSHPTGTGVPESFQTAFPGFDGNQMKNQTRSGIAVSDDLYNWKHHDWATAPEHDDRDVVLFPEKVNGQYAMLHDLENPQRVIKRSSRFIMEPEMYYERFGLYIPNVIFPTGGYIDDDLLHIYYGVCDTAIARASIDLGELMLHLE